jgi:2-(1,2-epoxy-1,2-dihydrophenyl)acetyl-CoA isomerase
MTIKLEKEGMTAILTLDRPEKLNALTDEMYEQLYNYLLQLASDDQVRSVILTGTGRAFCAGGDVGGMASSDIVSGRTKSQSRHRVIMALYNLEKPVVAAVRGPVYGIAAALVLACDLIVASETTKFSMAFKRVGMVPDAGVVFFLTHYVGMARAKEMVYTARQVSGQEAYSMGLVSRLVADDKLESESRALAREMADSAIYALALTKKMFQATAVSTLEMALETEALTATLTRLTHDHKEAVSALKEKRTPQFLGR